MTDDREVILKVENLRTWFPVKKGTFKKVVDHVKAVDDVSLEIYKGETLGIVGESGCGKSTFGKSIMRLEQITDGKVIFNYDGQFKDVAQFDKKEMFEFRKKVQMVFQDPYSALNPQKTMLENPNVAAVKNSSMPVQDIQMFKMDGGEGFTVFNGPDEQLVSGLAMGADGGIGGTYGVMPELFLKIFKLTKQGEIKKAQEIQYAADAIIYKMCSGHGSMYGIIKAILRKREGLEIGGVRKPMPALVESDMAIADECAKMIDEAVKKYC